MALTSPDAAGEVSVWGAYMSNLQDHEIFPCHDPLDCIREHGWRICWLSDYDHCASVFEPERIVIIDPALTRREICDLLRPVVFGVS